MAQHPVLLESLERLRTRFEADDRCVGMYLWGSMSSGTADDWSDVDVAAVLRDDAYESVKAEMQSICNTDCGPVVVWLPEGETAEFVNDAFLFQVNDRLHLYDFMIMSASYMKRTPWVRPQHIYFDKTGALASAVQREAPATTALDPVDLLHQIRNYWVYSYLNGKYYKRHDTYKMLYVQGVIFQMHMKVLRFLYAEEEWTWWARDIHTLPATIQNELLVYYGAVQPDEITTAIAKEFSLFTRDAQAACAKWHVAYPLDIESSVRAHLAYMGVLRTKHGV